VICCSNVYKSIAEEISYNSPISKTRSNLQELSAWKVNDRLAYTNDRIATGKKRKQFLHGNAHAQNCLYTGEA
jgi:hypothetical protein